MSIARDLRRVGTHVQHRRVLAAPSGDVAVLVLQPLAEPGGRWPARRPRPGPRPPGSGRSRSRREPAVRRPVDRGDPSGRGSRSDLPEPDTSVATPLERADLLDHVVAELLGVDDQHVRAEQPAVQRPPGGSTAWSGSATGTGCPAPSARRTVRLSRWAGAGRAAPVGSGLAAAAVGGSSCSGRCTRPPRRTPMQQHCRRTAPPPPMPVSVRGEGCAPTRSTPPSTSSPAHRTSIAMPGTPASRATGSA